MNVFETLPSIIPDDMPGGEVLRYMLSSNQFVLWRKELNDKGKLTKVPYQVNGYKASPTGPRTWTTLDKALEALRRGGYDGIGYVFTEEDPLVFVDVDHCKVGDEWSNLATEFLQELGNGSKVYRERSQSGEGLHFIMIGSIPEKELDGKIKSGGFKDSKQGLEFYDRERYVALTGDVFGEATDVGDIQTRLLVLWEKYRPHKNETRKPIGPRVVTVGWLDDLGVIRRGYGNPKFKDLFEGRWEGMFPSQSEADVALCTMIAFWVNRDPDAIERIFGSSQLAYRSKWIEREDYRERTIAQAIEYCTEDLEEFKARKDSERRSRIEAYYLHF